MPKLTLNVHTVLEPRGPAAAVVLTDDQVESFGAGKAFGVRVTIAGHTEPARLARMGGENLIGLSKAKRQAFGVEIGDEVDVLIELDTAPRDVEVPADLAQALDSAGVRERFDALAYSHRKEHVRAIEEAKKPETRQRRIVAAVEKLRQA